MEKRIELHEIFCNILETRNVYYQPPESVKMKYPAIVYSRSDINNTFADDKVYIQSNAYEVTVIDEDPDSEIVKKISLLPNCRYSRHFEKDNLNHDVFIINY